MSKNNNSDLTSKNLDQLAEFLTWELEDGNLSSQIPDGAHIFYGSYNDSDLTQSNLKLASKILLGMTLGYVEDAPLMMVYEQAQGERTLFDLSEMLQKQQAQAFIGRFEQQNQKKMSARIKELLAV